MFGLLKSLKKQSVSNVSGLKDFSDVFESIQTSKEKVSENIQERENNYNALFHEGMNCLKIFSENENSKNDLSLLHQAAKYFTEALEIKKTKAEPYFYLAYVFYLIQQTEYAINYLKVVAYIDPEFPKLENLREKINKSLLNVEKVENIANKAKEVKSLTRIIPLSTVKKMPRACLN